MPESGLFKAVLQLPPEERRAFLDRACGGDPKLRLEVESLLEMHEATGSFLNRPAFTPPGYLADTMSYQPGEESLGSIIGTYKLLQQIGEGGMGVVYMAEQHQPVHRRVALKVIKPGMNSKQVIARFEAERQALAMMDHLNIARVLDAGTTPTGLPYFVMELVHGIPLTRFCDENSHTLRQRLELFIQVCHAIQHAHQKGIIHRDIKPSNILVTMYDDEPVAKVIDFGIAKAIEQRLTEKTVFTQFGGAVGTFEYMSPEQAEMNALGVDTRSDIYSLGVVLYELLTGTTPLDRNRLQDSDYVEIVRRIKDEEPPTPSKRLSTLGDRLGNVSQNRNLEPTRLLRGVRGDLDWIVMKCLEKNRADRYENVGLLARDIQAHLDNKPVEARPPSVLYRCSKFVRRNRTAVVVSGVVFLTLLIGGIGTLLGLLQASREHKKVVTAQDTLRMALVRQIAERLQSDFKQLEGVGHTIDAALATRQQWNEAQVVDLFKPLLLRDRRLFGLGLALRPFRVLPAPYAPSPHLLAATLLGSMATPVEGRVMRTAALASSAGYCVYVHRGMGRSLEITYDPSDHDDHRTRDWYNVPLLNGRPLWTPITGFDEQEVGKFSSALVGYMVPLHRNGEVTGVLCVDIMIKDFFAQEQLHTRLKGLDFGKPSYAFVVSNCQRKWEGQINREKGIFISHPNEEDKRFQYPNGILQLNNVDPRFRAVAEQIVKGEQEGAGRAKDPRTNHESTFLYVPLKSAGWTVEMTLVVVIDEES